MKYHILFNPLSGNGAGKEQCRQLDTVLKGSELEYISVLDIKDYAEFLGRFGADDEVVICGGDGTLNRFINNTEGVSYNCEIGYFATGTGNDFLHDLGESGDKVIPISKYLKDLPIVTVKGKDYRFLNGIGYGIDGYCCEVGDKLKETSDKPVNYAGIAIKGLLFHFKPSDATVTVDGEEKKFKKVWLAPTMKGRYYGGGMMPTPDQDRLGADGKVSILVWSNSGKLKTLTAFPSIFKGEHLKHKPMCQVFSGHNISVRFEKPCALQVDGETILDVSEYSVRTCR